VPKPNEAETTYPLRAASRLTGLSPELLRAWERRYQIVEPLRTAGGTRRYRASDLERLRLVKAAVDAGHRISQVAALDPLELLRRATPTGPPPQQAGLERILVALDRLDSEESQRLLTLEFSALGPVRFARELALPLVREIGERWADKQLGIASEHLATGVLRSMLGSALRPNAAARLGPTMVFATPSGERHELGLQSAALTAMGAGANPIYLGAELPVEDLIDAVVRTDAIVLALSLVTVPARQAERVIAALREGLPAEVRLWVGGIGSAELASLAGVERIATLDELEKRVTLLEFETRSRR
jgi:DNA-binding transcriptional MerR regulator/methylmalonyl-CoA mutase cobalamin-binding subunit